MSAILGEPIIKQTMTADEWLQAWFDKNQSVNSVGVAKTTLSHFRKFILEKYPGVEEQKIIGEIRQAKDNTVYVFLNQFVQYLNKTVNKPKSIRNYYGFLKSYLRAQGIMIINDYAKTMVQIPKVIEPEKKALEISNIQTIMSFASPRRRAYYLCLVSSMARPREVLQWKKKYLVMPEDESLPILVRMPAPITKNRIKRETYISHEAWVALKPIWNQKGEEAYLFCEEYHPKKSLAAEEHYFQKIRRQCGYTEKTDGSPRYQVNIYSLKSFCFSVASDHVGADYARALAGHKGYMQTYYTKTPEQRRQTYLALMPHVTVSDESRKDTIIREKDMELARTKNLESELEKIKVKLARLEKMKAT